MLLDCPTCSRCYHADPAELGDGRLVICPRCQTRWYTRDLSQGSHDASHRSDLLRLAGVGDRSPSIAAEPVRRHARPLRPRFGTTSIGVGAGLVCAIMLLIGGRETVVQLMPSTAPLYAAAGFRVHSRGLEFAQSLSARRDVATSDVVVTGEIRNKAKRRLAVPRLVFAVRDAAGATLVSWTETAQALNVKPGTVLAFTSSPHHLPVESRTVLVTFETDGDHVDRSSWHH